jgi:hypothetical protein
MEEIWKQIKNYENYSVSTLGQVRNDTTGKILKGHPCRIGYIKISLYKNEIKKTLYLHRLVALTFISNPENKSQVDHIDNDKLNNYLTNLRWATSFENQHNVKKSIKNTSGVKGVYWYKSQQKWLALIHVDGIRIHLGYYNTIEEATIARQTRANLAFGIFTNACELMPI